MVPGQQVREYILESRIGEGGMAEVWLARHAHLDKRVALKILRNHPGTADAFRERFLSEARAMATLQHPNLLSASDFFFEEGTYFLVLPYIDGGNLEDRLNRLQGPLPIPEALVIAQQVLAALDYAHQKGIIHRDVKPGNILLDKHGQTFLSDFGIALMIGEDRRTRTGTSVGTPHYMSPEQIMRPRTMDHRADVYSFGCVLYEMLTGRAPFELEEEEGDPDLIIKNAHLQGIVTPPASINDSIPPGLNGIVMRAMSKDPGQRFQGCGEFARALSTCLTEVGGSKSPRLTTPPIVTAGKSPTPIPQPKPTAHPPVRKWFLSPPVLGLGAVLLIAVVGISAIGGLPKPSTGPEATGTTLAPIKLDNPPFMIVNADGTTIGSANTLQSALDAAPGGSRILIRGPEIFGSFRITKPLTLAAQTPDQPIKIIGSVDDEPVLSTTSSGIRLIGLTLSHKGDNYALYVGSGDVEALRCTLSSTKASGAFVSGLKTQLTITGGSVQDCGEEGVSAKYGGKIDLKGVAFQRIGKQHIAMYKGSQVTDANCTFDTLSKKTFIE
jgi:eukaryotic-like serine/threonine-protein kinase